MRFVDSDKAIQISKSKAIALCLNDTIPVAADREAGEPASERKANTPECHSDKKANANPSHKPRLEDAEVLEKKSNLDHCAVGDVYG